MPTVRVSRHAHRLNRYGLMVRRRCDVWQMAAVLGDAHHAGPPLRGLPAHPGRINTLLHPWRTL